MNPVGVTDSATLAFIFDAIAKQTKGPIGELPISPKADRARFELAEGCPSTVFKTVSLDRSDICPMCNARNVNIAQHSEIFSIAHT